VTLKNGEHAVSPKGILHPAQRQLPDLGLLYFYRQSLRCNRTCRHL
jgi:hypothetical protein